MFQEKSHLTSVFVLFSNWLHEANFEEKFSWWHDIMFRVLLCLFPRKTIKTMIKEKDEQYQHELLTVHKLQCLNNAVKWKQSKHNHQY